MATINRFEDLEVWQEARELCRLVFRVTSKGPFERDFRFRDQIRSASGSIMDNIAEGFERDGNGEFKQFLSISKASAGEVRSQIYRALDQEYISMEEFKELYEKNETISNMLGKFINYLKSTNKRGRKFNK